MNSSSTIISDPDPTDVMPTTSPPTAPIAIVAAGLTRTAAIGLRPRLPGAPVQPGPEHHRRRAREQRRAERDLHVRAAAAPAAAAEQVQQVRAEERHRHRPRAHPADEPVVDRALAHVHERPDRPHHHGGDQVAGDRRGRLDVEQQDQHGRHQRPAARPGQPHQQPDDRAAEHHIGVDVQSRLPFRRARQAPGLPTIPGSQYISCKQIVKV